MDERQTAVMFSADAASKGREPRSDSYIGRIRNFLGFNPSEENLKKDSLEEQLQVTDVRKDLANNHNARSSFHESVPKLVLKEL